MGLSGKSLAQTVLGGLINVGLDIKKCREQDYDEAAGISEHVNRSPSHISKLNSIAIYTVRHSHYLNLAISASCNTQCARNIFDQIKQGKRKRFNNHAYSFFFLMGIFLKHL